MNCFSCMSPKRSIVGYDEKLLSSSSDSPGGRAKTNANSIPISNSNSNSKGIANESVKNGGSERGKFKDKDNDSGKSVAQSFTFKELAIATQNFREANMIGEGGFGCVYKGRLDSGVVAAIKQLNLDGLQGNQEFIVEVLMLSLLHHPNLVNLMGYCTHGQQRLLVYEFMPMGSLENHLFDLEPGQKPLSWSKRMKIALGTARGLEYLHTKANPPVIYRDLKSSNILLDDDFNVKLSDFGLAKLGPVGDKTHVSTRVMGTYGYCAPEYAMSGKLNVKSDIYSFGVVVLELITGRKAMDFSREKGEQNLVVWSQPFRKDEKKYLDMVDPLLEGQFSRRNMKQTIAIAQMCLHSDQAIRPVATDIVNALEFLAAKADKTHKQQSSSSSSLSLSPSPSPSPSRSPDYLNRRKDHGNGYSF